MDINDFKKMIMEEISKIFTEYDREEPISSMSNYQQPGNEKFGYKINPESRSSRYLFTVANDEEGRERIKRAKEALSPYFKFQLDI